MNCEKCGKPMVIKDGKNGKFLACSGYPACKNTKPLPEGVGTATTNGEPNNPPAEKKSGEAVKIVASKLAKEVTVAFIASREGISTSDVDALLLHYQKLFLQMVI